MGCEPHTESDLAHRQSGCERADIKSLAPHDYAALARDSAIGWGELEQIQFCWACVSSDTEHYLGCKQKLRHAVNDNLGLEDV